MQKRFFFSYVEQVLFNTNVEHDITIKARILLNCIICGILEKLAIKIYLMDLNFVNVKCIKYILAQYMTIDLLNNCLSEGDRAIDTFSNSVYTNCTLQKKANILFPPSLIRKFITNPTYKHCSSCECDCSKTDASLFNSNTRYNKNVFVFIASVMEYLTADILQTAASCAKQYKKVRISDKHIIESINTDVALSRFFLKIQSCEE